MCTHVKAELIFLLVRGNFYQTSHSFVICTTLGLNHIYLRSAMSSKCCLFQIKSISSKVLLKTLYWFDIDSKHVSWSSANWSGQQTARPQTHTIGWANVAKLANWEQHFDSITHSVCYFKFLITISIYLKPCAMIFDFAVAKIPKVN